MRIASYLLIFILSVSFRMVVKPADKPQLSRLHISECITDFEDPDKLISESYAGNLYTLHFGMLLNCCGQDSLGIELKGDTLSLQVLSVRKSQVKIPGDNGDFIWVTPFCTCECYFKFESDIKNLSRKPIVISVNKKILKKPV